MRKVDILEWFDDNGEQSQRFLKEGWFHQWTREDKSWPTAIIETEEGRIETIFSDCIVFKTPPPISENLAATIKEVIEWGEENDAPPDKDERFFTRAVARAVRDSSLTKVVQELTEIVIEQQTAQYNPDYNKMSIDIDERRKQIKVAFDDIGKEPESTGIPEGNICTRGTKRAVNNPDNLQEKGEEGADCPDLPKWIGKVKDI